MSVLDRNWRLARPAGFALLSRGTIGWIANSVLSVEPREQNARGSVRGRKAQAQKHKERDGRSEAAVVEDF